jgi:signal transduction histidine kinase
MKGNEKQQNHRQADHRHSWWHRPLVGYPLAVLFVAGAFLIPLSERSLGFQDHFVVPPFVIATFLVGWIWGIGPALLALLLEILALDYWLVPPLGVIDFFLWPDIASFAPFILIQLIVLGMVVVQKKYRQQLLHANQAISQQAKELAESIQACRESNAQLERADRVKDQFLSMAAHELRTPVTSIQGRVQLLQRRLKRQGVQNPELLLMYDSLSKVEEQTHRLVALVNDLLDINILRSGKMPVRLAPCDLCVLCRRVIEEQNTLTGRQIEVKRSSCPLVVQIDEERISQVIINLFSNALKYSPASTVIYVEVSQRSVEAILAVHNEGSVLSQEQQKTIFEPFSRCPEAQSFATSGWGLGLAICNEIVERHGGRLWVESTEEMGTTFLVALPLPTGLETASPRETRDHR